MPKNLAAQKVSFSADPSSRISAAILVREITLARSAGAASAQVLYPVYGYAPYGYGYAATAFQRIGEGLRKAGLPD